MITPSCPRSGGEGANFVAVQVTKRSHFQAVLSAATATCYANALRAGEMVGRRGAYNNTNSLDRRQRGRDSQGALSMQERKNARGHREQRVIVSDTAQATEDRMTYC